MLLSHYIKKKLSDGTLYLLKLLKLLLFHHSAISLTHRLCCFLTTSKSRVPTVCSNIKVHCFCPAVRPAFDVNLIRLYFYDKLGLFVSNVMCLDGQISLGQYYVFEVTAKIKCPHRCLRWEGKIMATCTEEWVHVKMCTYVQLVNQFQQEATGRL